MLLSNASSLLIRRNTHMRSLFVAYTRINEESEVVAGLYSPQKVNMNIALSVITTDVNGIEIRLPDSLTGIFYLSIRDGQKSLCERISLQ